MDDFKKLINNKMKHSLSNQTLKQSEADAVRDLEDNPCVIMYKKPEPGQNEDKELPLNNPHREQQLVDAVSSIYYKDETGFDISEYELKLLPEILDINEINRERRSRKQKCEAVTRRVSDLILRSHPSYSAELQKVGELTTCLTGAANVCRNSRNMLYCAQLDSTISGIRLVANYRKRQILYRVLDAMQTIKTLLDTDSKLRELLDEESYPQAVQLCIECEKATHTFQHYACIKELGAKLNDTLISMQEQFDRALANVCGFYQNNLYTNLMAAYQLLGKVQDSVDQHLNHYSTAIQNTARTVLAGYIDTLSSENALKYQYSELCKKVPSEHSAACLLELCRVFWQILYSYHCVVKWHEDHSTWLNLSRATSQDSCTPADSSEAIQETNTANVCRQRLLAGLTRLWQEVLTKVNTLLGSMDASVALDFNKFLEILSICNKFMKVGRDHFGCDSDSLKDTIKHQSITYFNNYHRSRMEELRLFLESESWTMCPVEPGFSVMKLPEFGYLKKISLKSGNSSPDKSLTYAADSCGKSGFTYMTDAENPFEKPALDVSVAVEDTDGNALVNGLPEDSGKNVVPSSGDGIYKTERSGEASDSDDENSDPGVQGDYIDEITGEVVQLGGQRNTGRTVSGDSANHGSSPRSKGIITATILHCKTGKTNKTSADPTTQPTFLPISQLPPIICNSALTLIRFFGRYLQMVELLQPIAFEVIYCLTQLFDYYLHSVYYTFAKDFTDRVQSVVTLHSSSNDVSYLSVSSKLVTCIRQIETNIIALPTHFGSGASSVPENRIRVPQMLLSQSDLVKRETLASLPERVVAAESVIFVAQQLEILKTYFDAVMPEQRKPFLQQFYSQTVAPTVHIRRPIYGCVGLSVIRFDQLHAEMASVSWEVHEISSQHNPYVDHLLLDCENLAAGIHLISTSVTNIPREAHDIIWEVAFRITNRKLVDGYAYARKCTSEGRGLMLLDFQQLVKKLEKLTLLRPIPDKDYVETYIKAYYMPEASLEQWIRDQQKEYTTRQLISLLNAMNLVNRRTRQKLITYLEGGNNVMPTTGSDDIPNQSLHLTQPNKSASGGNISLGSSGS